jgi:hypothetical protein
VIDAALDPDADDIKAAHLALGVIREVDPPQEASLEISGALDSEAIERMSLTELLTVAERLGIEHQAPPALEA